MKRSSAAVFTTNLILLCTLAISCVTSQAGTLPLPIDGLNEAYNQGLRNSQTVVTSTVGSCLDSTLAERTTHVWFYWTGEPSSAKLILTTRGVRADVNPRIYVNGQDIGQAVPDVLSYQPCEVAGGAENEYPFDPQILHSGWNEIAISPETGQWGGGRLRTAES
jgi:hypothetical protein